MQESEFRDWARRAFGTYEERLRRLEERPVASGMKIEVPGKIQGEMESLAVKLLAEVRAGRVSGLAIAYLTERGRAMTGWAEGSYGAFALSGATSFLGLEMLESVRAVEKEGRRGRPLGDGAGAAWGTDEGSRPPASWPARPPRGDCSGMTQEKEELVAQIERLIEALETADLGDDAEVLVVARGIDGLQRLIAEWREAEGLA